VEDYLTGAIQLRRLQITARMGEKQLRVAQCPGDKRPEWATQR
jgi:hypothetical protein